VTPPGSFGPAVVAVEKALWPGSDLTKRVLLVSGSAHFLPEVLEYGDWWTFIMAWLFGVPDPGFGTPSYNYPWTIEPWIANVLAWICGIDPTPTGGEATTPEGGTTPTIETRKLVVTSTRSLNKKLAL